MVKQLVLIGIVMLLWGWSGETYGESYVLNDSSWTWIDGDGNTRTKAELDSIITWHRVWLSRINSAVLGKNPGGNKKQIAKAKDELFGQIRTKKQYDKINNQERKNLVESLIKDSMRCNLESAILRGLYVNKVDFRCSRLSSVVIYSSDLKNALFQWSDLRDSKFRRAELEGANFRDSFLERAVFDSANLKDAKFGDHFMKGISFKYVDLRNVHDLKAANMDSSDLTDANLENMDLQTTKFRGAVLIRTKFNSAELDDAVLLQAELCGADLTGASLIKTAFGESNLRDVVFEPKHLPEPQDIAYAKNLERLTYTNDPAKLAELKQLLLSVGYRSASKKVNAALRRKQAKTFELPCFKIQPEKWLFGWTCEYGSNYWKPLGLLVGCFVFFFAFYYLSMILRWAKLGINPPHEYIISLKEGFKKDIEESNTSWIEIRDETQMLRIAFLFSVYRTFRLGFKDFSLNHWLKMILPPDFDITSRGLIRVLSAIQSIFSVYMVVLVLVSYFGRLFD